MIVETRNSHRARWWSPIDFWQGLHKPEQLAMCPVPSFVSYVQLKDRWVHRSRIDIMAPVCADSGGFTVVGEHGHYPWTPQKYADDMLRFRDATGGLLAWCAAMDWMCEAKIRARTGKTVREHQQLTVESLHVLRHIRPEIHWIPTVQGEAPEDYEICAELYEASGINLSAEPIVGLGSVCRRQSTRAIEDVVAVLRPRRLRLHGFGVKADGFDYVGEDLESADSNAGSAHARRRLPMRQHRRAIPRDQVVSTRHVRSTRPVPGTFSVADLRSMMLPALNIKMMNGIVAIPVLRSGKRGWVSWIPGKRTTWWSTHRNCANCLKYLLWHRQTLVIPRIHAARARTHESSIMALPGMAA